LENRRQEQERKKTRPKTKSNRNQQQDERCRVHDEKRRKAMHSAVTVLTVCAGLVFSLSCALLVEELIFGGLFRFMASHVPAREEVEAKQNEPARFVKYTHVR
jgi:hypothetical protein